MYDVLLEDDEASTVLRSYSIDLGDTERLHLTIIELRDFMQFHWIVRAPSLASGTINGTPVHRVSRQRIPHNRPGITRS